MSRRAKRSELCVETLPITIRPADTTVRLRYEDTLSSDKRKDLILEEFAAILQDLLDNDGMPAHVNKPSKKQEICKQNP